MKRIALLLIIISPLSLICLSQGQISTVAGQISDLNKFRSDVKLLKELKPDSLTYDGSPFLEEDFMTGDIHGPKGAKYKNIPLRYNIYNNCFEFSREGLTYSIPLSGAAEKVFLNNRVFISRTYNYKGVKQGYLEIIIDSEISLYKLYRISFEPATQAGAYQDARKSRFKRLQDIMMLSINGRDPEAIQNQNQLLKLFPKHESELRSLIKKEKLKLKREEDLKVIVGFLNSLAKEPGK